MSVEVHNLEFLIVLAIIFCYIRTHIQSKDHIRHILLYEFHKGVNASAAAKCLHRVYRDDVVSERSCKRWFSRFGCGNLSLKEGRSKRHDIEELEAAVTESETAIRRALAEEFTEAHTIVLLRLKRIGKVSMAGKWISHELSPENLQRRVVCDSRTFSSEASNSIRPLKHQAAFRKRDKF
ncbi:histone-lysine N-methyltransferase SETMAR-like [Octopus sinensis]|uniref:Histone-lysine N-methyltransferase SETMAR-like n=1 Tax=Octopus sinensis TaxID=2607531 RepID=A0A6P7SMC1_9MOLL|nr:histone-lysine N-methyltransferase SETMAR-like [Octopus sinensis]